jgi:hypothetical protein
MYGTTAWVSHRAEPRLMRVAQPVGADRVHQHLGRAGRGGNPVDDAPGRGRVDRVGHFAPDAVRQLLQALLVPVDPGHGVPGGRQLGRCRPAELAARAGHDRHPLAHLFLLPVRFRVTAGQVSGHHRIMVIRSRYVYWHVDR